MKIVEKFNVVFVALFVFTSQLLRLKSMELILVILVENFYLNQLKIKILLIVVIMKEVI